MKDRKTVGQLKKRFAIACNCSKGKVQLRSLSGWLKHVQRPKFNLELPSDYCITVLSLSTVHMNFNSGTSRPTVVRLTLRSRHTALQPAMVQRRCIIGSALVLCGCTSAWAPPGCLLTQHAHLLRSSGWRARSTVHAAAAAAAQSSAYPPPGAECSPETVKYNDAVQ
eukprot:12748-Heterococcus_DN1.PRE.1